MIIGIPREVKKDEYRVSVIPAGVEELVRSGHKVLIEKNAGYGSAIEDEMYRRVGAQIVDSPEEIFSQADMVIKVKEPLPQEIALLRGGQVLFTYFHLAASRELTNGILDRGIVAIAYETIRLSDGSLPLLIPMSEVAGRMAVHEGAKCLERPAGGMGVLLAGIPGVAPARVTVLGGGIVGTNAAKIAAGLGALVTVLDVSLPRLRYLDDVMPPNVHTLYSNSHNIEMSVMEADLLIGCVLIAGARAPVLVPEGLIKRMKNGAAIVDVSIDQGGCLATSRPTTHSEPTFVKHGVIHYCVTNMPGAVGRTSTHGLTNATQPYATALANKGWKQAARENSAIASGINAIGGRICNPAVAESFGMDWVPWEDMAGED